MEKIINEVHLYRNKMEALIKVLIWIVSWVGGILVLPVESKTTLGSAYFIYSLSLLMEFAPQIVGKSEFVSRFLHTIFCGIIAYVCVLSIAILLGVSLNDGSYILMMKLTRGIIVYMVLDTFVLWIYQGKTNSEIESGREHKEKREKFEQTLFNGNLGDIKGARNNE